MRPWAQRRAVKIGAALGVLLLASGTIYYLRITGQVRDAAKELDQMLDFSYPASAVVCLSNVDAACGQEAAQRSGRIVAWVADTDSLRTGEFIVSRRDSDPFPSHPGSVYEEATYDEVPVAIHTNPVAYERAEGRLRFVREILSEGATGRLYRPADGRGATIEWTANGEYYQVVAFTWLLASEDEVWRKCQAAATGVFSRIRYAKPEGPRDPLGPTG